MKMAKYISVITLSFFISAQAFSQPASSNNIKKLMEKTGAGDLAVQMMTQMTPALKNMLPQAPEEFWDDMLKEVNSDEIVELIIPIYQKYFTDDDIAALNSFYDTPAGKKMIKVQPAIIQESSLVGQQWGQKIAERVMARYQQRSEEK